MSMVFSCYLLSTVFINLLWWLACLEVSIADGAGLCFCNPKWIYNHTKTNWFGTLVLTILANVAFGPSALCYWFYKLCTVGRR